MGSRPAGIIGGHISNVLGPSVLTSMKLNGRSFCASAQLPPVYGRCVCVRSPLRSDSAADRIPF